MAPKPVLMFVAVGRRADRVHLGAERGERFRRELRERPVRAVDADSNAREIRAAPRDDAREVDVATVVELLDRPAAGDACVEQALDLLFLLVDELPSVAEELDAVVFGRVVRGGDHEAELVCQVGDRRSREHAAENGGSSRRHDAAHGCPLELRPRLPGVAADEHTPAAGPQRRGLADLLDEVGRQVDADDPADPIGPEVAAGTCHAKLTLGELRRFARLVKAGLLALHDPGVAREEALALERDAHLGIRLDESTGDAVSDRSGLARRATACHANAKVVGRGSFRDLERREDHLAMERRAGSTRRACGR